jgi:hypothetical protein
MTDTMTLPTGTSCIRLIVNILRQLHSQNTLALSVPIRREAEGGKEYGPFDVSRTDHCLIVRALQCVEKLGFQALVHLKEHCMSSYINNTLRFIAITQNSEHCLLFCAAHWNDNVW